MQEYLIKENNIYVGKDYFDVFVDMKKEYNAVLVGLSRKSGNGRELIINPVAGETIQAEDYAVLMCSGINKKRISAVFGVEEGRISE
jgi:Trk K+ transport system NAD-binding subunit